jgi:hypothetical protein
MTENNFKILGQKVFEEMNLPPILYKYRDWNNPKHKRILVENELYLSSPADFEDEFDCRVPIRYDLSTDQDIYNKYLLESKKINPTFSRQQHRRFACYWTKKGLLRDSKRIKELDNEFFEEFNKVFGVLSLTAIKDNAEMWKTYSADHSGFCVGFHTIPLLKLSQYFGGGGEVLYYDELPIIKPFDLIEKQHHLQIFSKLRKWEFEKEYRLTKFNIQTRQVKVPNEIFAELIFGYKISVVHKNEISVIVRDRFPLVKLFESTLNKNSIMIKPFEI